MADNHFMLASVKIHADSENQLLIFREFSWKITPCILKIRYYSVSTLTISLTLTQAKTQFITLTICQTLLVTSRKKDNMTIRSK